MSEQYYIINIPSKICPKHHRYPTDYKACSVCAVIAQAVTAKGKLLQEAHDAMDAVNGDYGSDTVISSSPVPLCLFCKARDYDGQEGIIHQDTCIIKRIRLEAK